MKWFVYVAGPYTKGDVVLNVQVAIHAGEELIKAGHIPYIPHLTHLWHFVVPHPPEFWYEYDLYWLKKCDCLVRLPGESKGADNEVIVAKESGLGIYDSVNQCIEDLAMKP